MGYISTEIVAKAGDSFKHQIEIFFNWTLFTKMIKKHGKEHHKAFFFFWFWTIVSLDTCDVTLFSFVLRYCDNFKLKTFLFRWVWPFRFATHFGPTSIGGCAGFLSPGRGLRHGLDKPRPQLKHLVRFQEPEKKLTLESSNFSITNHLNFMQMLRIYTYSRH